MNKTHRLLAGVAVLLGLSALLALRSMRAEDTEPKVAEAAGAAALPPEMPAELPFVPGDDGGRPIPQDPERQEEQRRQILAWNQRTLRGAYDRVGRRDPRWDDKARAALDAAALHFSRVPDLTGPEAAHAPAREAVAAGCDDPLILYLHARLPYGEHAPPPEEYLANNLAAARALENSDYPAHRRATALQVAAGLLIAREGLDDDGRKEAARMLDAALALLPRAVSDDEPSPHPDFGWSAIPLEVYERFCQLGMPRTDAFEWVDAAMAKIPALEADRLKIKGIHLVHHAWDARGSGFARTVTERGFRAFRERLIEAGEALDASWKLKPDPLTATEMITINKGLGGNRDEMEKWFERAMKADGNSLRACAAKMDWLDPKWCGTPEDLLAFGRACRNTRNWRAGITLLASEPRVRLATGLAKEEFYEYFSDPEIWQVASETFDEYLRHYPHDDTERSKYAAYAHYCKQYYVAHAQFRELGDNLVGSYYFSEDFLKKARDYINRGMRSMGQPQ